MSALTKHDLPRTEVQEVTAYADPFLAMIERAADRPEILDKLVAVRNAEIDRRASVAFWADFAQMQPALPTIDRNGCIEIRKKDKDGERNGDVQQSSKYALWADILEACSPHMLQHGFGISFRQKTMPDGKIEVTGILSHREGHHETNSIALMHDSTGSKNAVQAVGSSLSYGMRYMGIMLLGIASKQGDDNGKAAGAPETVSDEQVVRLQTLIANVGANKDKFLEHMKVSTLETMPASRFDYAVAALKQKEAAQ